MGKSMKHIPLPNRQKKAAKILSILKDFRQNLNGLICLDIGCSGGIISSVLTKEFRIVIGVDIDQDAVKYATGKFGSHFCIGDGMQLPVKDNSIDVIICNHVYEHISSADTMMKEIYRVMKKDGLCYFAAGNRRMFTWMRLLGKGDTYLEHHLSLPALRWLVAGFWIHDYTLKVIRKRSRILARIASYVYSWIPTYIWVIVK